MNNFVSECHVPDAVVDLPNVILDRQGVEALRRRLYVNGQEALWSVCHALLRRAVAVRPYGGYYVGIATHDELVAFCEAEGLSMEAVVFLYQANLFDYPGGGARSALALRSGYDGPLTPIRGCGAARGNTTNQGVIRG